MNFKLHLGDCIESMRKMADSSVDSIVTDPPYELGFMGKTWDASGIANSVEMWTQALRVLKPGGHLLAFSGSRTYHRMVCAIEDAGFEIRDQIMWVYGSGFPKSKNLGDEWAGWGTALKPAHEPIVVARKPLIGTVAANVLAHGTGAINVDGCRVENPDYNPNAVQRQRADSAGMNGIGQSGFAADHVQATYNAAGRWPANLIHDGSDEVLAAFPQAPGQLAKASTSDTQRAGQNVYGDMVRGSNGSEPRIELDKSAARFFYCAKASRADRNEGCDAFEAKPLNWSSGTQNPGSFQAEGTDRTSRNNHPTVKPTDLMRYLCRLVTPPGGLVLDPFAGSGSTGKAAILEGFRFIGCELSPDYIAIARARIENVICSANSTRQLSFEI